MTSPPRAKMTLACVREIAGLARANAWLVGGCVRDALLGRPTADMDLAVEGDARAVALRFARAHGRSPFALDLDRGTYRVVLDSQEGGLHFDFARLQGPTLLADLARRDFTVNALAVPASAWGAPGWRKAIVDPTGGLRDLRAKSIRMVAARAFQEDPLRLLRGFRLSAELGFGLTPDTLRAVKRLRRSLTRSAPERLREELLRLLTTPRAGATLGDMDRAGLLTVLLPELEPMRRTARAYYGPGGVLAHSLAAVMSLERLLVELPVQFPSFHRPLAQHLAEPVGGHPRYAHLKLVALFHDIGKPVTAKREGGALHFYGHDAVGSRIVAKIAARLRLSSGESRSLSRQVGAHMRPGNLGNQPVLTNRAIYRFYRDLEEDAVGLLVVSLADHFTYLSARARLGRRDGVYRTIRKMLSTIFSRSAVVSPPRVLDGHGLMKALRLKPGPEVGRLLAAIREAQAAGQVKTPAEAIALAKQLVHDASGPAVRLGT